MKTSIIPIGNSRGIRIPKLLLEASGLPVDVELRVKKGEIRIVASKTPKASTAINDTARASEKALGKDWNRPEEDAAWTDL